MPKTKTRMIRLATTLYTAGQWHADAKSSPLGTAMLSLCTTRTIHSEDHRRKAINEIQVNIGIVIEWDRNRKRDVTDGEDYAKYVNRLSDLWILVNEATVGEEWLTDRENLAITEMLYRAGKL